MRTGDNHGTATAQPSRADSQNCFVCGKPLGELWFCRIHRDEELITLCGSECLASHLNTARGQTDDPHQSPDAYENSPYIFVDREGP